MGALRQPSGRLHPLPCRPSAARPYAALSPRPSERSSTLRRAVAATVRAQLDATPRCRRDRPSAARLRDQASRPASRRRRAATWRSAARLRLGSSSMVDGRATRVSAAELRLDESVHAFARSSTLCAASATPVLSSPPACAPWSASTPVDWSPRAGLHFLRNSWRSAPITGANHEERCMAQPHGGRSWPTRIRSRARPRPAPPRC